MTTFATLELGEAADAKAWEKGCQSLGFMSGASIMTPRPTLAALKAFFRTEPEWIYFSGHIWGTELYGDKPGTADLQFKTNGVAIASGSMPVKHDPNAIKLLKETDFAMHKSCMLVILAGCSALASLPTMRVIRELFFFPIILGYAEQTDIATNTAMMSAVPDRFFANYRAKPDLINAWLQSGLSVDPSKQSKFSAFDTDGQEWKLVDSKVVKGRMV
jgi:hypothetical protein